jgi:ubiquitin C-terminal hydrolase
MLQLIILIVFLGNKEGNKMDLKKQLLRKIEIQSKRIRNIAETIDVFNALYEKIEVDGVESLAVEEIQFLRKHNIRVNTDPTIY